VAEGVKDSAADDEGDKPKALRSRAVADRDLVVAESPVGMLVGVARAKGRRRLEKSVGMVVGGGGRRHPPGARLLPAAAQ
jgi:hypothetical protein